MSLAVLMGILVVAQGARADDPDNGTATESLGLDPATPQVAALPGGTAPSFGQKAFNAGEWRFDFHGLLTAPLNAGINARHARPDQVAPAIQPGQSKTVLHAPPVVPDDLETFSHTGVVPTTYAQLNLSEGNGVVAANLSILARQTNVSESFLEPASQLGISDAFVSVLPDLAQRVRLRVLVGAFTSRYGSPGEYDEGRYGTPLIARINGAGEQVSARVALHDFTLLLEQGIQGQTNKAGANITPDVWNDFANPAEGTSFVNHLHAGLAYRSLATLGAHFISAWSQDDRATGTLAPDGNIAILASDLRLTMGRFGHFYVAFAHTEASHARTVSRIIGVLNTRGGPGLADNYLAGDATGSLSTVGGQYDLSLGRLVSYPVTFRPDGPDVVISVFTMATHVTSSTGLTAGVYGNGVTKAKFGVEGTYALLPWLAVAARFDEVTPNADNARYSFAVLSPRIILHTGWTATDQVVLQYSHWMDGSLTTVRTNAPPVDDVRIFPDTDMLSLSASMWW
ncbi:MAG: hypothetical protein M3O46_14140 [Myxococcota bacterium]|nr:hypothetical protein [Myxococcota bacterium]